MHWIFIIPAIPYFIILMLLSRRLIRATLYSNGQISPVKVSIIIPCRNEEASLPLLLGDIAVQDYPALLVNVIVVDDHSSDGTFKTATLFSELPLLRVLQNRGCGKKSALGYGIEEADTEIIITTDADCRVGKKWLRSIVSFWQENTPEMIICPVRLQERKGLFQAMQGLEFLSLQGITAATAMAGNPVMCNGANLVFNKRSWIESRENLHPEIESGDDIFLLHSMKKNNSKIMWLHSLDAAATAEPAGNFRLFIKQRARWISKAGDYNDNFTNLLAIVTFITIINLLFLYFTGIVRSDLLGILAVCLLIKSIPDFLILFVITRFHSSNRLLQMFIPAQILYPFYVITVVFRSFFDNKWR